MPLEWGILSISQPVSSQRNQQISPSQERNRALDEEMRRRQEKLADARCVAGRAGDFWLVIL